MADDLRGDPLDLQQVQRGLGVPLALGLGPRDVQMDLSPTAHQPFGQPVRVHRVRGPHRITGITQLGGHRHPV